MKVPCKKLAPLMMIDVHYSLTFVRPKRTFEFALHPSLGTAVEKYVSEWSWAGLDLDLVLRRKRGQEGKEGAPAPRSG